MRIRFEYKTYFINDDLGWGYHIFDKEDAETFRRNYGFKSHALASKKAKEEIKIMEKGK